MNLESGIDQSKKSDVVGNDLLEKIESDDFDISFKPITEGLGFNQKKTTNEFLKKDIKSLKTNRPSVKLSKKVVKQEANPNMGDLSAFYNHSAAPALSSTTSTPMPSTQMNQLEKIGQAKKQKEEAVELTQAPIAERVFAYGIDLALISGLICATFAFLVFIAGLSLSEWKQFLAIQEVKYYLGFLSVTYYLFYFTFFDATQAGTPGKSFIGIKLRNLEGHPAGVGQTFTRSILVVFSLLALGIPVIKKYIDVLTSTEVIQEQK